MSRRVDRTGHIPRGGQHIAQLAVRPQQLTPQIEIVAALAAADTHNTDLTEIRAYALLGIGGALYKQGRFQGALDRQTEAIALLRALAAADARNEEARQDLAQALEAENQTRSKLR